MIQALKTWKGRVQVDGIEYNSIADVPNIKFTDGTEIVLIPNIQRSEVKPTVDDTEYIITVKPYMTKKASPDFDFMAKWNKDIPMPLRTMVGKKIRETNGMVYMELHGDIIEEKASFCMKCGRQLTNPVSQYFGIGPECGGHNYTHPFDTDEELREAVRAYKEELKNLKWEGWVIRSSITHCEVYDGNLERH